MEGILKLAGAKLGSAIGDQVMMQWNLKKNLEDMKGTLEYMEAVLNDAERRSIKEKSVLLWLKRLKNAAYDISDMLDDFQNGKKKSLLSCVPIVGKNSKLANRMEEMKQQLTKIQEDHERFQFSRHSSGNIEQQITDQRETIAAVNEDVVGREEEKKNIVELFLERNSKEETIIVPIHGLGGIGKTTLARLVFNDTHFKEYDHRVWVYVSQVLDLKKIGNNIISQVSKQESRYLNDLQPIYQRLEELLNGKKCLIVLDDLWEEKDTDQFKNLKTMLINVGKAGSKIDVIVTTRDEEIAQNIATGKSYPLKPLDDAMCWSIIKKRCNFEYRSDKEQLEQIGQNIANKCAGIALAAQALGSMLSSRMNLEEWSAIRDSDIWNESSSEDTSFPLPSLMLSYQSMPSYLKLCFAYCAIFSKGQNIRKYDLIHQWIALDFIKPSNTSSATQLGEKYVRHLLGMSFLRHSNLSSTSQRPAVFTMHDLVHDLATSVMADELLVSDAKKGSNSSGNKYCRCAFLTNYSGPTKLSAIFPANVRALRFLDCQLRNDAFSFAKHLRVLDVSGCLSSKLPKCVTQLSRLQYLNFSWCRNLEKLPEDIGSLTELQYLKLSVCDKLGELPESFQKLHNLVHLDLSFCYRLDSIPESLGNLERLHTLDISHCESLDSIPESLGNLERLHTLDISHCESLDSIPESLGKLKRLHTLDISRCYRLDSIPESLGNLERLHTLDISYCYRLDSIPESLGAIRTLKFMKVERCSNKLNVHMMYSPLLSKFVESTCFMVHANDVNTCGNLHPLENVNPAELEICSLENVRFLEEARRVKLFEKQNLSELTFDWALDACRHLKDKDVLEELVPPRGLKHLELRGYSSIELPTWLMDIISSPPYLDVSHHLPNLVKIKLENLPMCNNLPPLGQLSYLEELHLIRLCSITKIGEDLCGGGGAFSRLSTFTLEHMEGLEEWSTTYYGEDGVEEFMFPKLKTLKTSHCPSLRLKPCPPIFSYWHICRSDKVISSWGEGGHISFSFSTPPTGLEVEGSKMPMDKWGLLHHIPTLQELKLYSCDYLASLPESMRYLVSLRSLELEFCSSISVLPEWMGDVTSLESLKITECQSIKSLPQCVQQLTKLKWLNISESYELQKWCESEENKIKLAHIKCRTSQRQAWFTMHDLVHDLARSVMADELLVSNAKKGSKSSRNKYCRYAFLTNYSGPTKLSAIFPANVRALCFLHCQLQNDAFSFAMYLRVLDLPGCPFSKLPKCVTQHSRLQYLNLRGSGQISALPESIGKIERLMHLDLTGCSSLVTLPKAFSSLTKLQYLNLSWCRNLEKLPEDIGSLTELQYLNLSCCSDLGELPESFKKLHNLVHLDLSGCKRLDSIPKSLGNLERLHTLDISRCERLDSIPESLGNLERLHTLDISHCSRLDSIPESLGNLERLHTLDISHCSRLDSIPESLGNLERLHTLDISHCFRLDSIPGNIGTNLKSMKAEDCSNELKVHMTHSPLLSKFVESPWFMVHANDGNLHPLENVNPAELGICSLENVRFLEEARRVKLFEKQNLSKLTFDWALDACRHLEDKDVLEELVPPRGLKHLELRGYSSIKLPTWLMGIISSPPYPDVSHHLRNLVKIKLENLPWCNNLPPLGQLPNLEELHLIRLCKITKIGKDLCGGGGAFSRLSTFTLEHMERLEEWSTTYYGEDGVEEFMFPKLKTLKTLDCPSLRLKPCPPIFSDWYIGNFTGGISDKVISSWGEGGHIGVSSSTPPTRLEVMWSKMPMDKWGLLHHIPTLQELKLYGCDYLASLPESMRHLVSLRLLELKSCSSISVLPEWMGNLTSLERLIIDRCSSIKSLPQCVQQLTKLKELNISESYELQKWCESEENKIKLAHIKYRPYRHAMWGNTWRTPRKDNSVSLQLFMVSDVNTCSKLHQLEDVNLKELKISCLENVRSLEEARKIKLLERQSLSKLTLEWTSDEDRFLEDKDVLGELVPPRGLQHLELDGYSCISFPTWLMGISHYHYPNLIEIKLENLPRCSDLSPLGQLPNLVMLHLGRLQSMTKIDRDFCAREGAFLQLSEFTLYDMEQLDEWNTTYCREDGVEEFMFPKLDKLDIGNCPKLRLTPRPPIFRIWKIKNSDMVISSWSEGDHINHSPSDTPGTTLDVWSCKLSVGEWRLLHHLPTLEVLAIFYCHKLTSLPENIQHLASLQSLQLNYCNGISALPEWLGHLTSLERLGIEKCGSIKSLPHCIQQLTKLKELKILFNHELEKWCKSDENKMKLAHIENISYDRH